MSRRKAEALEVGGPPRADLLPVATREAIRRRPIVRRLITGLVALAVLVALAIVGSVTLALLAMGRLDAERARTEALLAQQLEFAEARAIDAALTESVQARRVATMTEVDWNALLTEIRGTLPTGVLLTSVTGALSVGMGVGPAPGDEGTEAEPQPLRQDSIGSFRLDATSPTVPDVESWLDDLEGITGFAGIAPPVSVVGSEGASYTVTIEVLINQDAYLGRYAPETDAATETEE